MNSPEGCVFLTFMKEISSGKNWISQQKPCYQEVVYCSFVDEMIPKTLSMLSMMRMLLAAGKSKRKQQKLYHSI
jgi:hypothetical protein